MHSFAHWVVFCLRILHHQTKCSNMTNISAQEVSCVREYVAELNKQHFLSCSWYTDASWTPVVQLGIYLE